MFIAALVTIPKCGNNPHVKDEQINKMWSTRSMEYCLALKKNDV